MLRAVTRQGSSILQQSALLDMSHRTLRESTNVLKGHINQCNVRPWVVQCRYISLSSSVCRDDNNEIDSSVDSSDELLASRADIPMDFQKLLKPSKHAKNRITQPVGFAQQPEENHSMDSNYHHGDGKHMGHYDKTSESKYSPPVSSKPRNHLKQTNERHSREGHSKQEKPSLSLNYVRNKEKLMSDGDPYSSIDYMEPHRREDDNYSGVQEANTTANDNEFTPLSHRRLGHRLKTKQEQSEMGFEEGREKGTRYEERQNSRQYNFGLEGEGRHSKEKYDRLSRRQSMPGLQGEALFGKFPCLIALSEGRRLCHRLYCLRSWEHSESPVHRQILQLAEERGVEVVYCERSRLDLLSMSRPNQGVCLDASQLKYEDFEQTHLDGSGQMYILMDSIKDPMNLGSILRAAYYLGVDKVLNVTSNSVPLTPVVSKASTGVMEILPIYGVTSAQQTVQLFHERGWQVLGTVGSVDNKPDLVTKIIPVSDVTLDANSLLVIGSEGRGISHEVMDLCDRLVTIAPGRELHQHMDSLNVSVATGIVLHQLLAKKTQKGNNKD